jgi:transposase
MRSRESPARPPSGGQRRRIGVGIDTSRYGHCAAFLRDDLQPAAPDLSFAESAGGYAQLRQQLERLAQRLGPADFFIRVDAAGQYADNLLHFLHALAPQGADPARLTDGDATALAHSTFSVSCGDPQRNKNYRAAVFGSKKSDPIEALAAARFAVTERPAPLPVLPVTLRTLRQVAARLQAVVRQRTRLINQFHHLLALTFPELALLTKDLACGWVLELVHRYPTATLLAAASNTELQNIPYLPQAQVEPLLQHARASIASLNDPALAELLRDQVRQLRDARARQKRLENLLVATYKELPTPNHLATIPGIGDVSAAVLTAFILDIDRFAAPNQLVKYFGILPIEVSSGVDRDGKPRGPKRYVMSPRGNDLVRRYLWMAALSAIRCNAAARALYARVVAKHPAKKAIAVGHVMRKLLHLAFALWKTGKPFDPHHYPWDAPAHVEAGAGSDEGRPRGEAAGTDPTGSQQSQAAGPKRAAEPARTEVTAACTASVPPTAPPGDRPFVAFGHLKCQLSLAQVLDHLGLLSRLAGNGPQRRGPCPLHRGDGRGRSFSVNLDANVFHCFDQQCQQQGDVIDLWARLHGMSLRDAALDLVRTFHLEPAPVDGTEKRQG